MLEVIAAKYLKEYRILITFNNGEQGEVDLQDALWGPVFAPLKDPGMFARFEVSSVLHTLVWKNDADLAPEFLLDKMREQRNLVKAG